MLGHDKIFEGVLYELNKVEAPPFYIDDYNYYVNKAISKKIEDEYKLFEKTQESTDTLSVLSETKKSLSVSGPITLDGAYRHLLKCVPTFKIEKCFRNYKPGKVITKPAKRMTDDLEWVNDNYYLAPDPKRPYFKIESGKLYIKAGFTNEVTITKVELTYLKNPVIVALRTDANDNIIPASITVSEFPYYVDLEIISLCAFLFLENISDSRVNTFISANQVTQQ